MTLNRGIKWIVLAILMALVAAGGLMAWAASPDSEDDLEPAESDSGGVKGSVSVPAATRRAVGSQIAMDAELVGTAIVEGGTSYAMFQSASGTRFVREGDEISSGVRLVQVRMHRIEVERNGVHEEIRVGWSGGTQRLIRPGSNPAGSGVEKRALQREYLKAKGVLPQG